ncbi:hypothetical protein [Desulforhopalus singaporensis]|nr:hypothetical protein [Desulforhopalus singaporensis]
MEKVARFTTSPVGVFIYGLATAVIGIALLLGFLSILFGPAALPPVLPALAAFNGAAAGYGVIDKTRTALAHEKLTLTCLAVLIALSGSLLLPLFCPWEPFMNGYRHLVCTAAALPFTFFGSWIARKSKHLKNNK